MSTPVDFVIVGTGGGGGTIAWLLAKAGFRVVVLEQGTDWANVLYDGKRNFNEELHDEYRFRLEKPDPKRRPRGDYNTFRRNEKVTAKPFKGTMGGWTASALGGGSLLWGCWAVRALPVDFKLKTLFRELNQTEIIQDYSVVDWPIHYQEMEPYFNIAEALFSVCGDRDEVNQSIKHTEWYQQLSNRTSMTSWGNMFPKTKFPSIKYPQNPIGSFFFKGMEKAGMNPTMIPTAIANPQVEEYLTREKLQAAINSWDEETKTQFWKDTQDIWSNQVRDACNMCGFCGEYVCWGSRQPKSGTLSTTIQELRNLGNFAEIRCNAKVYEITYDQRLRRATGVRYLDVSDPDNPKDLFLAAKHVILCAGAIQTARLLLMSGPPEGLGNRSGMIGRNVMFHTFGLSAVYMLPEAFTGLMHSQFGHSGTVVSYSDYFVSDDIDKWYKAGIVVGTAKKNPLENADTTAADGRYGIDLLRKMEQYPRTVELRVTGDDLPQYKNRVDLDPRYVDEYGFPVARITRDFGPHELTMFNLMKSRLKTVFDVYHQEYGFPLDESLRLKDALVDLFGDHQMGTCRMGDDPLTSVTDRYGRMHDVKNIFIADTSVFPTGLGVNPMITTVANALRIGSWIVEQARNGSEI
ncbi:GMC oxidoreductase [Bacillus subtilis]|uniref:GMC oxidoreductase n=1 Tax=Bacillus subtilis TaxID=1423 RepID=UPI00397BB1F8